MNKFLKIVSVVIMIVFSRTGFALAGDSSGVFFFDDFNGSTIDGSKWVASVNPPRFSQDDPSVASGNWTTPTGTPSYGTITVNNSLVSLVNGNSTVFPYVVSTSSPFPVTGDFSLEFKMKYDSVSVNGSGLQVHNSDFDNPLTNDVFAVWQDWVHPLSIYLLGTLWQAAANDISNHIYTLSYIDSTYTVLLDGVKVLGPITSSVRPNQLWFGNPVWTWWGSSYWSTESIDYIKVNASTIDTVAPVIVPIANRTILWPPNRKMQPVTIWANASDNSGMPVRLTVALACH